MQTLNALHVADCMIVCLDEGYEGLSVPSKTYYALAAGAALIAVSPPNTELTDLIAAHKCGVHVSPRAPAAVAAVVRGLHADRRMPVRLRLAARGAAIAKYARESNIAAVARSLCQPPKQPCRPQHPQRRP